MRVPLRNGVGCLNLGWTMTSKCRILERCVSRDRDVMRRSATVRCVGGTLSVFAFTAFIATIWLDHLRRERPSGPASAREKASSGQNSGESGGGNEGETRDRKSRHQDAERSAARSHSSDGTRASSSRYSLA